MSQDHYDQRHTATAMLASFFVIVIGLMVCVFFILAFSDDPTKPIITSASVFFGTATLIWLLREKPRNRTLEQKYFWLSGNRSRVKSRRYRLKLSQDPQVEVKKYGTNTPPTAKEIQELSRNMQSQNWTPKSVRPKEH